MYEEDSWLVVDRPIPASMVLVLDKGWVEDRLVVYDELGCAPTDIWKTLRELICQYASANAVGLLPT